LVQHSKLGIVDKTRKGTDKGLLALPLPKINPNIVSGMSIFTSIAFLLSFQFSKPLAFVFIVLTLLLDWLDGLIARKHNLSSEEGYMVDVTADRISEGIMFILFPIWFILFAINNMLTMISFTKNRHIILPLRHIFLVYFIIIFLLV